MDYLDNKTKTWRRLFNVSGLQTNINIPRVQILHGGSGGMWHMVCCTDKRLMCCTWFAHHCTPDHLNVCVGDSLRHSEVTVQNFELCLSIRLSLFSRGCYQFTLWIEQGCCHFTWCPLGSRQLSVHSVFASPLSFSFDFCHFWITSLCVFWQVIIFFSFAILPTLQHPCFAGLKHFTLCLLQTAILSLHMFCTEAIISVHVCY